MGSVKLLKMQRHKELTRASGSGAAWGSCRAPAPLLPSSCPGLLPRSCPGLLPRIPAPLLPQFLPLSCPVPAQILPKSCPAFVPGFFPASGNSCCPEDRPPETKPEESQGALGAALASPTVSVGQAGAGEEGAIWAVALGSTPGRPE